MLPLIQGTPVVELPWKARFFASIDRQSAIAASGVAGNVWGQNRSVRSVETALVKSPLRRSLQAAVLLVPSVRSANLVFEIEKNTPLGGGMFALAPPVSLGPKVNRMPLPSQGR